MVIESVRALVEAGCQVTVALPDEGPLAHQVRLAGADVRCVEMAVLRKRSMSPHGVLALAGKSLRELPAMINCIRRTRADLVYVNTLTIPTWLVAARLTRTPSVCHVHEAETDLPRLVAIGLHAPLLLAHQLWVNSAAARNSICEALPRLSSRLRLLYNGIDGPTEPPTPPRVALVPPLRLVLVGRLSPRKGIDVAVSAIADLKRRGIHAHLDLVGEVFPGYEWYADELRLQVQRSDLTHDVAFRGFQPDVWQWLADADVVLVPSRLEPFGNVAVEAALAQRPVIASRVQGLREIVTHRRTGLLIAPDDPAAIADAVSELADNWPWARTLAAEARADAQTRFGPRRYGEDLMSLLMDAGFQQLGLRPGQPRGG